MRSGFSIVIIASVASIVGACTRLTPEQQVIADAAAALGGANRIRAVRTIVIEGEGKQYNFGQDLTPEAAGQTFTVEGYRRAIDVQGDRARTEFTRTPRFAFWLGPASQNQIQGVDGHIGYNLSADTTATRVSEAAANDRRAELLRHPVTSIRSALAPDSRFKDLRTENGQTVIDVAVGDGRAFTLAVDATSKLPVSVSTRSNHAMLGDIRTVTAFADYENVNGLQLPRSLTTKIDDAPTMELRAKKQAIDADVGDLAAPGAAATAAPPAAAAPNVTVVDIARGVWQLGGSSHRSVVIEFADRMVLFEAPQSDARTLAVIARARELRPAKPLTHVINTHHHFDHAGGVRAAVSEGLTLVTHKGNAAFYEALVKRPRTLAPDALSKNPKPLALETVDDFKTLSDGRRTMVLYSTPGTHSSTMLVAYLPAERMIIEADLYEPSEHIHVYAAGLLEEIKKRFIRVDRIVSLHSDAAPFSQLLTDAAKPVH